MNRPLVTHSCWLLITIGTFVVGSRWAGTANHRSDAERAETRSEAPRTVFAQDPATPLNGSKSERRPPSVGEPSAANTVAGSNSIPGDAKNAIGRPLTEKQLGALVRRAIRSSSPLERRQAFDQLLEEMRSGAITREQALALRIEMDKNGASPEQWRLFDYNWGASDPESAIAHVNESPEGFLSNMIPGLASVDPQAAIDLYAGLKPDLRDRIRKRLFEGLIDNDVEVATNYIFDTTDLERFNWRPMDELTREIVKDEGLEPTLEWAADLPEGPLRGSAWSAAYAHWATTDPQVAVQKIIDMPPSQDRNQAINGFISALAHRDGERAVQWAAEITQPGMREAAMVRAAKQFYRQDQQSAADWFGASGLPANVWEQVSGKPWAAPSDSATSAEGAGQADSG